MNPQRHEPHIVRPPRGNSEKQTAEVELARKAANPALLSENSTKDNPSEQLLWNTKTACFVLGGISPRTLHRLEQRGLIKSVMLTRHKLYTPKAVQRLVEEVAS